MKGVTFYASLVRLAPLFFSIFFSRRSLFCFHLLDLFGLHSKNALPKKICNKKKGKEFPSLRCRIMNMKFGVFPRSFFSWVLKSQKKNRDPTIISYPLIEFAVPNVPHVGYFVAARVG